MEDSRLYVIAASVVRNTALLLTFAGIFLAIGMLKASIVDPGFPAIVYPVCIYAGLLLVVAPLVAWMLARAIAFLLRDISYPVRCVRRAELEEILPLYDRLIGGERPSLNEVKELFNANREILRIIEKRTRSGLSVNSTVVGFCSVLPLTKLAADLVEQEKLNGLKMGREHVCTPKQTPYALYIGSIGAEGFAARGRMLGYLLGVIDDQARHNVRVVYTRPVSKDGLRLARQHDFLPVGQGVSETELKRLYKLVIPKEQDESKAIRKSRMGQDRKPG